jgi:hypothetical protein
MFARIPHRRSDPALADDAGRAARRSLHPVGAAIAAVALLAGVGALASSTALAAPPAVQHPAAVSYASAAQAPAVPAAPAGTSLPTAPIVAAGTYQCGAKGEPTTLGTINWAPAAGTGGITVIKMWFWAHNCLVLSGPYKGKLINTVEVQAAFPITPNSCVFSGTNRENLDITYPGVNFGGVVLQPSYASVNIVSGGAFWKFTSGLVGGSFANAAGVSASFRPIVWVGGCPGTVSDLTLAQTDINELANF